MNTPSPYNANPELSAMKEDIASRNYNLRIKHMLILGASLAGGIALGALLVPTIGAMGVVSGGILGFLAGGKISEMMTLKERTKLQIDEEMTQSYMSGKNYWGEGYRKEVAEHGYAGPQVPNVPSGPQQARGGKQAG